MKGYLINAQSRVRGKRSSEKSSFHWWHAELKLYSRSSGLWHIKKSSLSHLMSVSLPSTSITAHVFPFDPSGSSCAHSPSELKYWFQTRQNRDNWNPFFSLLIFKISTFLYLFAFWHDVFLTLYTYTFYMKIQFQIGKKGFWSGKLQIQIDQFCTYLKYKQKRCK